MSNPNLSYIIVESSSDLSSYLYSGNFKIYEISKYRDGHFSECIFAFSSLDNNDLRYESLTLLNRFGKESLIVKYLGESSPKLLLQDGQERELEIVMYNTDSNLTSYISEGISFSFIPKKSYLIPTKKEDLKDGMTIECLSNEKWIKKRIVNISSEYDKMYSLLIKYNKVRIPV